MSRLLLALGFVVAAPLSCTNTSPPPPAAGGNDGGVCQAGVAAACTSCLSTSCSNQVAAAQSDCTAVISCYCECNLGDSCCVKACGPAAGSACATDTAKVAACATASCASECAVMAPACGEDAGAVDASTDATIADATVSDTGSADTAAPVDSGGVTSADASDATTADASDAASAPDAGSECDACVITIAVGQSEPAGIAVDTTWVYWTTYDPSIITGGAVRKAPVGGGAVTDLAVGRSGPNPITVDSANVYWGEATSLGSIIKVPIDGGAATTLASGADIFAFGIAVDATNVYWTNTSENPPTLMMVPIDGGAITTLASSAEPNDVGLAGIALRAGTVFWIDVGTNVGNDGALMALPLDGGAVMTLVSNLNFPYALAADQNYLYVGVHGSSGIIRTPLAGGSVTTLAVASVAAVNSAIAVDSRSVYWVDLNGVLNSVPIDGGAIATIVPGQTAESFAVGATNVFWDNWNGGGADAGTIMTAPK